MNAAIRAVVAVAQSYGFSAECLPDESQYRLIISKKQCQILRCRAIATNVGGTLRTFIPVFAPRSPWADFLVLFVTADANAISERFYIVPRTRLKKRTILPALSWIQEYANAWHLLSPKFERSRPKRNQVDTFSILVDGHAKPEDTLF